MRNLLIPAIMAVGLLTQNALALEDEDENLPPPEPPPANRQQLVAFDDFPWVGAEINLRQNPPQVCFADISICIQPHAATIPQSGNCSAASLISTMRNWDSPELFLSPRIYARRMEPLAKVLKFAKSLGYPRTIYFTCINTEGVHYTRQHITNGALCFAAEDGTALLACAYVEEDPRTRTFSIKITQ